MDCSDRGIVVPGKVADLVIVRPKRISKVRTVLVGGRKAVHEGNIAVDGAPIEEVAGASSSPSPDGELCLESFSTYAIIGLDIRGAYTEQLRSLPLVHFLLRVSGRKGL